MESIIELLKKMKASIQIGREYIEKMTKDVKKDEKEEGKEGNNNDERFED